LVNFQVGKVSNLGIEFLLNDQNGLSSLSGLNLRVEVPSYMLYGSLSRRSSISSPLGTLRSLEGVSVSRVFGGLINLPIIGGV